MWVVMTSAAAMPQSCKGRYRNIALVQLNQHYTSHDLRPAMISERAKGVLRVNHRGHHSVGKTERCAYQVALRKAEAEVHERNNSLLGADVDQLTSWGGSA